jgi:hypothetical protein
MSRPSFVDLRMTKPTLIAVASLALSITAHAATDTTLPGGWFLAGEAPKSFQIGVDGKNAHGGKASAFIKALSTPTAFGTLMQNASAAPFLGKRVRFTGYLKTENAERASLWLRVDGKGTAGAASRLAFDNMDGRVVSGTTPWKQYTIVLDVGLDATSLGFGVINMGGTVWADDLRFEVVDLSVPTTASLVAPANLDFEQ